MTRLRRRRGVSQRDPPDLTALDERDAIALGRDHRRVPFADPARRAAAERHDPDRLLDARRETVGVGVLAAIALLAAADVDDRLGVGRPAEVANLMAVCVGIVVDRLSLIVWLTGIPPIHC